jgi:hypothetical protein
MAIFGVGVLLYTLTWLWVLLPIDNSVIGKRIAFFIGWQTAPLIGFLFSDTSLSYLLQVVSASIGAYLLVRFTLNTPSFVEWRRQYYSAPQD